MVKHDAGIDRHGTTWVIVVLDQDDRVVYRQRLRNELGDTKGGRESLFGT